MSISERPGEPDPNEDDRDIEDQILDTRIEQTLESWFAPPPVPASALAELQKRFEERLNPKAKASVSLPSSKIAFPQQRAFLIVAALAASILVAFVGFRFLTKPSDGVIFNRQPLAIVYDDLVTRGFEPYYLCDDPKRFREIMQHRHGQSLALNDRGNQLMLGLSYPGGWTSETTAILFRLDGEPVVIFVDSQPFPEDEPKLDGKVNIRVKELPGIFMVEVSPVSESILDTISKPAE